MSNRVPADSTSAQFPFEPLPAQAKRMPRSLFQLFVQQGQDAMRRRRLFRAAILVEDHDLAVARGTADVHTVLLRLDLDVVRAPERQPIEQSRAFLLLVRL